MKVQARFPQGPDTTVDELLAGLERTPTDGPLRVGDERIVDFLTAFSRKLLQPAIARRFPELASLGFFLRKGEIAKATGRLEDSEALLHHPRGLVYHVPPANVDTIFVYSWALSALAGNRNVVRISQRSAGAAEAVLDALNEALATAHPTVAETQRMVTYGREDAVTEALSAACDLRVIWGGDRSVREIRRHALAPHARDLTFPDRASFAVVSVSGWQKADAAGRRDAVAGFVNDAYWFDQAACASPRGLFWVAGDESPEAVASARAEFLDLLVAALDARGETVDAAMAVQKRVSAYGVVAEGHADSLASPNNAVLTLELTSPAAVPREWLGAGTFPQATLASLDDLAAIVVRRDQTLSHFGFERAELTAFARALAGRGIDRIVPFGSALTFAAVWDGYDLVREFVRLTSIS